MRKVIIIIAVLSLSTMASAQGFKLGVAGNMVFPLGDFKEVTNSTGYGVDAFGVFDLVALTVTARVGYLDFGSKDIDLGGGQKYSSSVTAIPVMGGLRWDFGLPVGPSLYAGVEAGIHSFTTEVTYEGVSIPNTSESETKFALSPNIGLELAGFDISAYYMYIKDASYWGLRLGWGIGI